jgi:hypothetical protein
MPPQPWRGTTLKQRDYTAVRMGYKPTQPLKSSLAGAKRSPLAACLIISFHPKDERVRRENMLEER